MALRTGLNTFKASIKEKQSKILTAEKIGLIKNIITVVPMSPNKLVCQEKNLNLGLKFGAAAKSRPRQAKLTDAYDSRKRTEHNCAIRLRLPMSKKNWTNNHVVNTAATGLSCITP